MWHWGDAQASKGDWGMIRRYGAELRAAMMLADIAVTALLAIVLSEAMLDPSRPGFWQERLPDPLFALGLFVSSWVTILWLHGAYRLRARWSIASEVRLILNALVWFALLTFAFLYLAKMPDVSRAYLIVLLALMLTTTVLVRVAMRWAMQMARRRGQNLRNVVIIGTGAQGRMFAQKLAEHPEVGLHILGFVGDKPNDLPSRWRYIGPISDLPELIHSEVVDEVAICLVTEDWALIEDIAAICESEGKIVRMPVAMPRLSIATAHVEDLDGMPVVSMLTGPRSALALATKRLIDVVGATVGLVVLTPLFAGIALAIVATDGRPVFYRQERVGLNGRRFPGREVPLDGQRS